MILLWILLRSLLFSNPALPAVAKKAKQPPVILITIDDLRDWTGAYGKAFMHTPVLDSLCTDGYFFTNHYVAAPSCGPSRYAFLTGRYPRQWSDVDNNVFADRQSDGENHTHESFVAHFRDSGYRTIGIGKISHSPDGRIYGYGEAASDRYELPNSWDEMLFEPGKWGTGWNAFFGYADGSNRNSLDNQVKPYECGQGLDTLYPDAGIASEAVRQIRKMSISDAPTLLAVGFFKPHLPFTAPEEYWKYYEEWRDTAGYTLIEDTTVWGLHPNNEFNRYALGDEKLLPDRAASPAYAQKLRQAYAASVSYTDAQVGKVIQALKAEGLYDDAIVIVWGDHGWHLGEKGIWGKHTLFDVALRSPLIIKLPGGKFENTSSQIEDVVSSIDLYPTLLAIAGLELGYSLAGKNLLPHMLGIPIPVEEQAAFSFWSRTVSLRTPGYRYTESFRKQGDPMLFKLAPDKHDEKKNIAISEPALVHKFSDRLHAVSPVN